MQNNEVKAAAKSGLITLSEGKSNWKQIYAVANSSNSYEQRKESCVSLCSLWMLRNRTLKLSLTRCNSNLSNCKYKLQNSREQNEELEQNLAALNQVKTSVRGNITIWNQINYCEIQKTELDILYQRLLRIDNIQKII